MMKDANQTEDRTLVERLDFALEEMGQADSYIDCTDPGGYIRAAVREARDLIALTYPPNTGSAPVDPLYLIDAQYVRGILEDKRYWGCATWAAEPAYVDGPLRLTGKRFDDNSRQWLTHHLTLHEGATIARNLTWLS